MNLSVIIPVYNEVESLPNLKKELKANLINYHEWEVIFVDDGSSDGSSECLYQLSQNEENFKLIQFYKNYGKYL